MDLSPKEFHPLVELATGKTSDGVLCLDTDGKILMANDSAVRTLGQTASALVGKTIFDIAPEMNSSLWHELWKEIRARGSFAFEFGLSAAEGRLAQVDISVHHLQVPGDRELACVFFRDIEERKRLQNLQQEFVSTASHELRSPMTVIREGVSQVLEGLRGEVNDSQRRALSLALNAIDRLGRIIDELLDMSKIESGRIALKRERLDLAALVRETGATFQSLASDRGLDLRLTTPAGPVMVYADRDRLIQVLTNLINNSFKFTEKGRIEITVSMKDEEAECSIADTGIGLASDDVDKIFNKFEQLGQVAVTGEKGTGLGLSICRGIVELHKGRIWAESKGPGQGARVTFALPKQSGRDVFWEMLEPTLRDVARRGGSLSTVLFRIENIDSFPVTEAQVSSVLAGLEQLVRKHSGRMTDLLVKDMDAMYLGLESMVKREGARIADRVVAAFEESLVREKLSSKLRMSYQITGFPEEAADEEKYLEKVIPSGSRLMPDKFRLLLVDDDAMIVELLTMRLEAQGYEVCTAINGEKAYEAAAAFKPHVIICDVVMPKVDGPTFCRRMRSEGNDVPFLFLTAKGQSRDKVEVLSAGADDYLIKPFEPQELAARITAILRRRYPTP